MLSLFIFQRNDFSLRPPLGLTPPTGGFFYAPMIYDWQGTGLAGSPGGSKLGFGRVWQGFKLGLNHAVNGAVNCLGYGVGIVGVWFISVSATPFKRILRAILARLGAGVGVGVGVAKKSPN